MKIRNGTEAKDRLSGTGKDDTIVALGGNDIVLGRGGHDLLDGGEGKDRLDGGDGDDTLLGGSGDDLLIGGAGNDLLDGGTGVDVMRGGAGDDTYVVDDVRDRIDEQAPLLLPEINTVEAWIDYRIGANLQNLVLKGTAQVGTGNGLDNRLFGNELRNTLAGGDGADSLYGFEGRDRLVGGEGDDWLDGGSGDDTMVGGAGNDLYVVDSADDVIVDTDGTDFVLLAAPVTLYAMAEGIENLTISAVPTAPDERISVMGNALGNRIDGGAGNDIIDGGGGDDLLWGGDGWDTIYAGSGDDIVLGSLGNDWIYLGGGRDVVIYQNAVEIAGDSIAHFGSGCRIDLSVIDPSAEAGDQSFAFLGSDAFTGRAGEIRCETNDGGFYSRLFIDLDGDKIVDLAFSVEGAPPTEASFNL